MQKALATIPNIILGSNLSGQVAAASDLVNQAGIPMIAVNADPSTDPGQQNGSDWYFRLSIRSDRRATAMSRYGHDTLGAKKVVIGHSTDLASTSGFTLMKQDVEAMGIQVTETSWAHVQDAGRQPLTRPAR
jgi:ABC-type branched-subunit amino acid transport system substrate-binding protein